MNNIKTYFRTGETHDIETKATQEVLVKNIESKILVLDNESNTLIGKFEELKKSLPEISDEDLYWYYDLHPKNRKEANIIGEQYANQYFNKKLNELNGKQLDYVRGLIAQYFESKLLV